jgi:DNA-binding transcriptional MocR family regulator
MKLYETVARELEEMIRGGSMRPGDQLPSVRSLCLTRKVSRATVVHAYSALEGMRLIEARDRSGYYVSVRRKPAPPPVPSTPKSHSTRVVVSDLVFDTLEASRDRRVVPLGSAFPGPMLFPWKKLARYLGSSARHMDPWSTVESLPPGSIDLRRQIARRYLRLGMTIGIEQIVITAGALEALNLALLALTRPGDTIAIESPTFYGCLQAAERLGLNVIEIPTHPTDGINMTALTNAISKHSLKACWFMTTLQHPTGAIVPSQKKRELVELLSSHDIPLIEDDAYADLQFSPTPAVPAKAFDKRGLVLHCGTFSKCLAPGYRLGWVAAGRFADAVIRGKVESSLSTSLPVQLGIAEMLQHGGYDSHLLNLRQALESQQAAAFQSMERHFPPGYRSTHPKGGYFLWIECAAQVDSLEVHRLALASGISIAPGPMFSARRQFGNFIRLNYGHTWTSSMDAAVAKLGAILRRF